MNEQNSGTRAVLDAYAAAVYAKDVDAFMAIHDEDIHVYDSWGQWEYAGAEAWRGMATEWFGWLGDERVVVEMNDVKIVEDETVAWAHAAVMFAGESASGERLRAITNRGTFCLAKRNGTWKIIHQHTSLPIDMETMKAIHER